MFTINKKGKSRLQWTKVADSGNRTAFNSGSVRDTQENKGRFDLIPTVLLTRLAQHYENGALKYGDGNWQKGQPLKQYYNSAMRHLLAIANADLSEDHFSAAIWNIACMMHHIDAMLDDTLPVDLDSFGIIATIKEEETMTQLKEYFNEPHRTQTWTPTSSTWIPVLASGMIPDDDVLSKAWDKDRFKENKKLYRTTHAKLDPEGDI